MDFSVVLPVYNERKALPAFLKGLFHALEKTGKIFEVIAVDDGSTDGSAEEIKGFKGIKLVRHPYNKGYGAALKTGIRHAKHDWVLIIDADGSYNPADIPALLGFAGEYDMVVGARQAAKGVESWYKKPAKWFLRHFANYLTGMKIPDLNSGLRVFRKDIAMEYERIFPSGFSFTTTITLAFLTRELNVKYVPI